MHKNAPIIFIVTFLVIVIVTIDLLLFRDRFWERLIANIGVVLILGAVYFRYFK